MTRVLVVGDDPHGMPIESYAEELRARLDAEVVVGRTTRRAREAARDATVLTGTTVDPSVLDAADDLQYFACAFAGHDHLPMARLREAGVAVTNAAGVHAPNVGEHVVGTLLGFARGLFESQQRAADREWRAFQVGELQGSTVGVVGLGGLGTGVVDRLEPFGVETLGVRANPDKGGPTDEVFGQADLDEVLARSEYLVLACPLTEETEGLIGADELSTMRPDAVLVNVARGPVVETDALVEAIQRNEIGGAALDVTDPEPLPHDHRLWTFSNVLITPHNAGHTPKYYARLSDIVAENVRRLEAGDVDEMKNLVVEP